MSLQCTWRWCLLILLLISSSARNQLQPFVSGGQTTKAAVEYQAVVGEEVELTCPVEVECPKQAYSWRKSTSPDPEAPSDAIHSIEKTVMVKVGGAWDGGIYSCFSYCNREVVSRVKVEVLPSLAVSPNTEVGLHSGETLQLSCSASGFPQPMAVWSAAEDVRIDLKLKEHVKLTAVDKYTMRSDLVIEKAHPDMSGSYICAACYLDTDGKCEVTGNLPKTFVSVAVYDPVQLGVSARIREFGRGEEVVLECKVISDLRLSYWVIWKHNQNQIDNQTAEAYQLEIAESPPVYSLKISAANESHEGSYWCVVGSTFTAEEASDHVELSLASRSVAVEWPLSVNALLAVTSAIGGAVLIFLCGCMWQHGTKKRDSSGTQTQQTSEPDSSRRTDSHERMNLETFARKHGMEFRPA